MEEEINKEYQRAVIRILYDMSKLEIDHAHVKAVYWNYSSCLTKIKTNNDALLNLKNDNPILRFYCKQFLKGIDYGIPNITL